MITDIQALKQLLFQIAQEGGLVKVGDKKAIALVTCTECQKKFGTLVGTKKTTCPHCGKHLILFREVKE